MEEIVDTVMSTLTGIAVGIWLGYRWGKEDA